MAIPQKLIPKGSLVAGGYWSGKPGLEIYYNPAVGTPSTVQGSGLDPSIYREKEEDKQALHIIAGDNEVLSGNKPAGANAASALNLLLEQSMSKFGPLIQEWERFIEAGQVKKANLIRRMYQEPRANLVRRMKQINKDLTTTVIDDYFTGKDLGDNIDVRVEAGSSLPRSSAMHQQNLKDLIPLGILGQLDPITNPIANQKIREEFGIADFPTTTGKDTERAKSENDLMRQGKANEVELMTWDNPVIHFSVVTEEMKRPEFIMNTKPEIVAQFVIHSIKHYLNMTSEQVKQAGISPIQEKEIVSIGLKLSAVMNPIELEALEERQMSFMPQPPAQGMMPPPGINPMEAAAGMTAGQVPPANSPAGMPGGGPSPFEIQPAEMPLNIQGGM
jgi:hypothetical protein